MKKIIGLFFAFIMLFSSFLSPIYALEDTTDTEQTTTENNGSSTETPETNTETEDETTEDTQEEDTPTEPTVKYGVVRSDKGIKVRNGAGTSYDSIGTGAANGQILTILETLNTTDSSTGCESGVWYKIKYLQVSEGIGYACSNFVEVLAIDVSSEFEASLLTFPESYREYLTILHTIYPNAVFIPYDTELKFSDAVSNENVLGKSLLWDTYPANYRDGLKNMASYDIETNSFKNDYPGGGKNWYAASSDTIAYYMDPRNFLTEEKVFMFEMQSYNSNLHTIDGVEKILAGSFMADSYVDNSSITFAQTIMDAGTKYNISPYFIASRILQEVGTTRSSLVLGTYSDYPEFNGYYNYYNIGAGGENVVYNGLSRAKEEGWDSEYKAIVEGSYWIGKNYILKGQDTTYFQKWNVVCKTGEYDCYTHQYMQNIEAPFSEASITYKAYKNNLGDSMKEAAYVFTIPVYDEMPSSTTLPNSASPINYLKSLVVNNSLIANFDPMVTDYEITIPTFMTSLNIEATSVVSGVTISGVGNVAITKDKQVIPITVTALNGNTLTYNITVTLNDDAIMTLTDTLANLKSGVIKDNYLSGLTNVTVIKDAFNKANSAAIVTIKDLDGKVVTDGSVGTGYVVSVTVGDTTKDLDIVIYGDNNGDSEITILDLLRVQKHLLKSNKLSGAKLNSCDVNRDGEVTILDLLLVQKHLLGAKEISQ